MILTRTRFQLLYYAIAGTFDAITSPIVLPYHGCDPRDITTLPPENLDGKSVGELPQIALFLQRI